MHEYFMPPCASVAGFMGSPWHHQPIKCPAFGHLMVCLASWAPHWRTCWQVVDPMDEETSSGCRRKPVAWILYFRDSHVLRKLHVEHCTMKFFFARSSQHPDDKLTALKLEIQSIGNALQPARPSLFSRRMRMWRCGSGLLETTEAFNAHKHTSVGIITGLRPGYRVLLLGCRAFGLRAESLGVLC